MRWNDKSKILALRAMLFDLTSKNPQRRILKLLGLMSHFMSGEQPNLFKPTMMGRKGESPSRGKAWRSDLSFVTMFWEFTHKVLILSSQLAAHWIFPFLPYSIMWSKKIHLLSSETSNTKITCRENGTLLTWKCSWAHRWILLCKALPINICSTFICHVIP